MLQFKYRLVTFIFNSIIISILSISSYKEKDACQHSLEKGTRAEFLVDKIEKKVDVRQLDNLKDHFSFTC